MSTAPQSRHRKSFTDLQRQRLRLYHHSYPSLAPQQLAAWFENETGRRIAPSSVYDILSDKYAYLDNSEATDAVRQKKGPQWAELEDALFRWWQGVQPREVTGKELKIKAEGIWQTLPACQGKKAPSFSDGWLTNWRVRHGLSHVMRSMEVEMSNPSLEQAQKPQCESTGNALFIREEIRTAQRIETGISDYAPFGAAPLGRLCPAYYTIPDSRYQNTSYPQVAWNWPPTLSFYSSAASASPSKGDFRSPETQLNGVRIQRQHKAKKLKVTASQPLVAAKFQDFIPRPKPPKPVTPFDQTPWKSVQELFLKCNALKGDAMIMSGNVVVDSLKPIISSMKYHNQKRNQGLNRQRIAAIMMEKAKGLFFTSGNFRVRMNKDQPGSQILEDWLLDFINPDALRSPLPDSAAREGSFRSDTSIRNYVRFQRSKDSKHTKDSKCLAMIASGRTRDGRIDTCTRTYTASHELESNGAMEHFQAEIVITPPADIHSVPQTIVHLEAQTAGCRGTLLKSEISFRKIIPKDSKVFKIAKYGNSLDLQKIISSGQASLTDCDPDGRSLINYALRECNISTLRFLVTVVEDIDAFEADCIGDLCSLIGLLASIDARRDVCERNKRLECLKLMLNANANPTLQRNIVSSTSTVDDELFYGTAAAMKASLDLSQTFISANNIVNSTFTGHLLLSLCEWNCIQPSYTLDVHEKIFILLRRGADIAARSSRGETCLQVVLGFDISTKVSKYLVYREQEFKDILICMVTAEADVYAFEQWGMTVSQSACQYGHEGLWREVLAECGFDPNEVFSLENDFKDHNQQRYPGIGVFSAAAPNVRSTKLSFKEYGWQRQSLECVKKVYNPKNVDYLAVEGKWKEFCESIEESSDNEDYECVVDIKGERGRKRTRKKSHDNSKITVEGYPELLHNGVHWRSVFN